jgi:hypothetical protein
VFPSGSKLIITVAGTSGPARGAENSYTFSVEANTVNGKSVLTIPARSIPTGVYNVTFESPAGENPYFKGALALNYSYSNPNNPDNPNDPSTPSFPAYPDSDSSGGGCAAGSLMFMIPLLGAMFVLLRKRG